MYDIILIHPKCGLDLKNVSINLPLSLMYISEILLNNNFKVHIVDQRTEKNWKKLVEKLISNNSVLCVGISSMTGTQIKHSLEISKFVKSLDANLKIVWGGVHPTILPVQTLRNSFVDIVVVGDGSKKFLNIANNLKNKLPIKKIKGIYYKENGIIYGTPKIDNTENYSFPFKTLKLLNLKNYFSNLYSMHNSLSLVVGKGCPHKCTYCYNQFFKKKVVQLDNNEIVNIIKKLVEKFGIYSFTLIHDNFFSNKIKIKKLTDLLSKINFKLKLNVNCRIDYLDKYSLNFINKLYTSGIKELFVGVESGSDLILSKIKKNINVKQIINVNRKLKKTKMKVIYSFMCGFPFETFEDIKKTIRLMILLASENKNAYITSLKIYTPYPGTPLFKKCLKSYGLKFPKKLEDWSNFNHNCFKKKWLNQKEILQIDKFIVYSNFFDKKSILKHFGKNLFLKIIIFLYSYIAIFRCKYNFHYFSLDYIIIKKIINNIEDDKF